ncbi:MAG TPA: DUF1592 domain-containing protein [Oligoflexia bacterium]|nr:DUF1592 domain-containing protein [Oligoflexia bacterium]HMR24343.1 DUF1592 domain-containing protein [Oligoflexia bacterium]
MALKQFILNAIKRVVSLFQIVFSLLVLSFFLSSCLKNNIIADADGTINTLLEFSGPSHSMKRLTQKQLLTSMQDLLEINDWTPSGELPLDGTSSGAFKMPGVAATSVTATSLDFERYRVLAKEAVELGLNTGNKIYNALGCRPGHANDSCVVNFFQKKATQAWSRKVEVSDPILVEILNVVDEAYKESGYDINEGIRWGMIALLQSAEFLYVVPRSNDQHELDDFSKARQLALMFTGTVPDQELLAAAARGELTTDQGLLIQVNRLAENILNDESARQAVLAFFDDWLSIENISNVGKDAGAFPDFSEALKNSMKEEIYLMLDATIFKEDGDLRQFFYAQGSFVNSELAKIYDLPDPGTHEMVWMNFPSNSPRSGFFSSPGFLAMQSHPASTTPTLRGMYIIERVLCQTIPLPPPNFDTVVPDPVGHETKRDKFARHATDPNCSGCHDLMDPSGFTLEEFDALGVHRETEAVTYNGTTLNLPINTQGSLLGMSFADSKDFARQVAYSVEFSQCVVKNLSENILGRRLNGNELQSIYDELVRDDSLNIVRWLKKLALNKGFWQMSAGSNV